MTAQAVDEGSGEVPAPRAAPPKIGACTVCKGTGLLLVNALRGSSPDKPIPENIQCPHCQGSGTEPSEAKSGERMFSH